MSKVVIYTRDFCGYCVAAKKLLAQKEIAFEEINATGSAELRQEMTKLTGGMTFPQVLIDDTPRGGFDDLYAMNESGELDRLLASAQEETA